jgi:hypothetical protein
LVVEIPLNGFADACLKVFLRPPSVFAVDFCGVDRIASVVAGTVSDEGDLGLVKLAIEA